LSVRLRNVPDLAVAETQGERIKFLLFRGTGRRQVTIRPREPRWRRGLNLLGFALMVVRDLLREQAIAQSAGSACASMEPRTSAVRVDCGHG
jgi:hypothetical protein